MPAAKGSARTPLGPMFVLHDDDLWWKKYSLKLCFHLVTVKMASCATRLELGEEKPEEELEEEELDDKELETEGGTGGECANRKEGDRGVASGREARR